MLPRSGFSIRRLISQRRPRTAEDDSDSFEHDEPSHSNPANSQPRTQSWTRDGQSISRRKSPPEPIIIRRSSSVHKISTPIPPLPDTPLTSTSSLCSCEYGADRKLPDSCDNRVGPRSLSPNSGKKAAPARQRTLPRRRANSSLSPSKPMHHADAPPRPSLNLPEKASHFPDLNEAPRRVTMDPNRVGGLSEHVQQLLGDADQPLRSPGQVFQQKNMPHSTRPPKSLPPLPPARKGDARYATQAPPKVDKPSPIVPLPAPPARNSPVSKAKKKESKKNQRSRNGGKPRPRSKQPRWTLTENMAELFSGQFFWRIEADEMLTPRQLELMKENREAEQKKRKSSESLRGEDSDGYETPIEPFHLEDLPSRIGAAGVKTTMSPIGEAPTISFDEVVQRDLSATKESPTTFYDDSVSPLTPGGDDPTTLISVGFPSPPLKNPSRFLSRPQAPQLPTIPEVLVTKPRAETGAGERRAQRKQRRAVPSEDDDFLFLASDPYTVTMPAFQHGPIRFSKTELGMKIAGDNSLDWTAFQTAILGGAGDFFSESFEFTQQQAELDEREELRDWFDDFGFETAGELATCDETPGGSPNTAEYSPVSSDASEDLPIPVELEHPNGFWNEGDCDTSKFVREGCGIKRWTVEGHPKPYNRQSVESVLSFPSLPQSPMMPLVLAPVSEHAGGKAAVPMGYNLGHDLGDFLRWEAEHVYMAAYYR